MAFLPVQRSRRWFLWMVYYGVLLTLLLWLNRFVVLDRHFSFQIALNFLVLSFALSIVVNGFGWLGARWIWWITTVGTVAGLMIMFYYVSKDMNGWEDLSSLLGFMESVVFGFGLGLLAEGVHWIFRLWRRGDRR